METLIVRFPSLHNDILLMHPTIQVIHDGADYGDEEWSFCISVKLWFVMW